jgi:hypothetical protein
MLLKKSSLNILSAVFFGWLIMPHAAVLAQAANIACACSASTDPVNVCSRQSGANIILLEMSLPPQSNCIAPDTPVTLKFSIFEQASSAAPSCSTGTLFHSVRHYLTTGYEYISSGQGNEVSVSFGSGPASERWRHRYIAYFYCAGAVISGNTANATTDDINKTAQYWETPQFIMRTGDVAGNFCPGEGYEQLACPAGSDIQNDQSIDLSAYDLTQYNPVGTLSVAELLCTATNWIITFGFVLVVIVIAWGAIMILSSAGEERRRTLGKETIKYALIGLVVLLLARSVTGIIMNFWGVNWSQISCSKQ